MRITLLTGDFLLRTIPYLLQDDKLAIVQSRWTHLNRYYNRVTSAVAIGIDVHFFVEQTGQVCNQMLPEFQWEWRRVAEECLNRSWWLAGRYIG